MWTFYIDRKYEVQKSRSQVWGPEIGTFLVEYNLEVQKNVDLSYQSQLISPEIWTFYIQKMWTFFIDHK